MEFIKIICVVILYCELATSVGCIEVAGEKGRRSMPEARGVVVEALRTTV